jgi:hypothetical protein
VLTAPQGGDDAEQLADEAGWVFAVEEVAARHVNDL